MVRLPDQIGKRENMFMNKKRISNLSVSWRLLLLLVLFLFPLCMEQELNFCLLELFFIV